VRAVVTLRVIVKKTSVHSTILYMMVVTDVLSKVVFAFEAIVATISIEPLASYLFNTYVMCVLKMGFLQCS